MISWLNQRSKKRGTYDLAQSRSGPGGSRAGRRLRSQVVSRPVTEKKRKWRTVVCLEELDERVVKPEAILLGQVIERVLLVDQLEHVGSDGAEARVLAQVQDPTDELVRPDAALKDRVQRFPVAHGRCE